MVDGSKAWANLQTFDPLDYHGSCLYYVSNAYDQAGADYDGTYATAYDAWNSTKHRHTDRNPPYGKPIWLGRRGYDGNMSGDVFIAGPSGSQHAATDYPGWGGVGMCSIDERVAQTGREYLGWSDDIMGAWIDSPGNEPEGDDVDIFTVGFDYQGGQKLDSTDRYLYLDDDKSVSVITGPAKVWGALYVSVKTLKSPDNGDPSAVQFRAVVDTINASGDLTSSSSLGTVEILETLGQSLGFVTVPPINLGEGKRLRFKAITTGNAEVQLTAATFRGAKSTG